MEENLKSWLFSAHERKNLKVECRADDQSGRGLYATEDIPPSTPIFSLNHRFLLNRFTLQHIYPPFDPPLTSTQLVSLHLFLHRHDPADAFAPFITSLPVNFDSHPLRWLVRAKKTPDQDLESRLLGLLPSVTLSQLNGVHERFQGDVRILNKYLNHHPKFLSFRSRLDTVAEMDDHLWAWLNVNTRCIHLAVSEKPSPVEDLTLCPLIDFVNHTPEYKLSCRFTPNYSGSSIRSVSGAPRTPQSVTFMSPPVLLKKGEQIFFQYGSHPNSTLFTEYGFILPRTGAMDSGEIILDPLIETMLKPYDELQSILEQWNYWREWSILNKPAPPHPSYRLLMVLRLIALPEVVRARILNGESSLPSSHPSYPDSYAQDDYEKWKATVMGFTDIVSDENERSARTLLAVICDELYSESTKALAKFDLSLRDILSPPSWAAYGVVCVKGLLVEVQDVAQLVLRSIQEGVEF